MIPTVSQLEVPMHADSAHSNSLYKTLQQVPKSLYNCTSITSNIPSVYKYIGATPAVSENNFKF